MTSDPDCIFCKIVAGEIPSGIMFRNDQVTAFSDINPQLPVHVLVVPNQHITDINALAPENDELVGGLLRNAGEVARRAGLAERGYRLVVNTGTDANNTVPHLHVHVLGGRLMTWPPG